MGFRLVLLAAVAMSSSLVHARTGTGGREVTPHVSRPEEARTSPGARAGAVLNRESVVAAIGRVSERAGVPASGQAALLQKASAPEMASLAPVLLADATVNALGPKAVVAILNESLSANDNGDALSADTVQAALKVAVEQPAEAESVRIAVSGLAGDKKFRPFRISQLKLISAFEKAGIKIAEMNELTTASDSRIKNGAGMAKAMEEMGKAHLEEFGPDAAQNFAVLTSEAAKAVASSRNAVDAAIAANEVGIRVGNERHMVAANDPGGVPEHVATKCRAVGGVRR